LVASDKAVLGLDTDPFCQHRFLSFGDESIVKLWDIRNFQTPLFSSPFDPFRTTVSIDEARFSNTLSGVIAILGKEDDHVTIWQLKETEHHESSVISASSDRLILWKVQRSKYKKRRERKKIWYGGDSDDSGWIIVDNNDDIA
jgi:hypothetical protein